MYEGHDQAIFELLAGRGLVPAAALQDVQAACAGSGKSLARLTVELGLLDRPALFRAVAGHLHCDCQLVLPTALPSAAAARIGGDLARSHGVAPLSGDAHSLLLAAADPFNPHLVNDLTFALGCEVRIAVADPDGVHALIRRQYGEEEVSLDAALGALQAPASVVSGAAALSDPDIEQLAGLPPIIRFVNVVLAQAVRDRASDIHFEPFEREFRIRYRIDGALLDMAPPPRTLAQPIISRLKVLANLNIAERRLPQDGRIRLALAGRSVDLRISTLPTQFGESVVLRVLDQAAVRLELGQLGLPAAARGGVEEVIRRPNGIFLVTGPTGSGKTTTLYSCLQLLNTPEAKLLTVEDPVEYEIDGIMQVPVNLAAGLTFAGALRAFLRQDPDIVMIGEIRDVETAQIGIQAALTGHLVLSTLHTNDAPSAITRLVDMGLEPFLLASTVEAVLAQRLLRRICPACRAAYEPDESLLRTLQLDAEERAGGKFFRGRGCGSCNQSGYKGRIGLFEFLRLSESLREMIGAGASLVDLRQRAQAEGLVTLRAAGLAALYAGDTTVEEVLKYT